MLQKLVIRNFQVHEKLVISFDPLITTIVGKSDVGKSSVIRALRWLITNRPSGTNFIRHGANFVRVALSLSDTNIYRQRGRRSNVYDLEGKKFKALGSSVPEEITNTLNVGSVSFQLQHDSPFWLSDSPGTVSKNLNAIIDLGKIDSTLANLASQLRKARTTVEISQERYQQAKKQRTELKWCRIVDKQLKRLEEQEQEIQQKRSRYDQLKNLVEEIERSDRVCQRLKNVFQGAQKVLQLGEQVQQQQERVQCLQKMLNRIEELNSQVERERQDVSKLESGLAEKLQGRCPLCHQSLPKKL